ncbi:Integrase zinc binding domain [Popillia japonica]|uniref:RNA-directed DNA polymerase n=1 Tax=Popillia japonica TaxID=7064 RepID=A0AAW1MDT1_POPJA
MCKRDGQKERLAKNFAVQNTFEKIKEYVQKGWPERKNCRRDILPYYKHRDYITIVDNMFTYQDRIIVPPHERKQCLKEIHSGHLGLNKSKARAKETVWWPGISQQITDMVNNCEECIRNSNMNHVEPMLPFSVETLPWICVGTDLFEFRAKKYLVVQDYYSKYLEVVELKSTKGINIINELKEIFSRFGIPKIVRSDCGKQYDNYEFQKFAKDYNFEWKPSSPTYPRSNGLYEFQKFAKDYNFEWKPSSPTYPRSNGLVESAVKTAKSILKKSHDPNLGLLAYRNTKLRTTLREKIPILAYRNTKLSCGASPSELLMGRTLREKIPIHNHKLQIKPPAQKVHREMKIAKEIQKRNYDKRHGAKEHKELEKDDRVWITNEKKEGIVKRKIGTRSYLVETENGNDIKGNRYHLKKLPDKDMDSRIETENKENKGTEEPNNQARKRKRERPTYLNDYR